MLKRKTDMERFLNKVRAKDFLADETTNTTDGKLIYICFVGEKTYELANVALKEKLVSGLSVNNYYAGAPAVAYFSLDAMFITPTGEKYLKEQKYFNKHPTIEKIVISLISGIIGFILSSLAK